MDNFKTLQQQAKKLEFTLWNKGKDYYLSQYSQGTIKQGKFNNLESVKKYLDKIKKDKRIKNEY